MIYLYFNRYKEIGRKLYPKGGVGEFPDAFQASADSEIASGSVRAATTGERDIFLAEKALLGSNQGRRTIQASLLLSSVLIDLNEGTAAKQPLYTVPPSRRLIVTRQDLNELSGTPTIAEFTEGWNASADDCLGAFHLSDLLASTTKSGSLIVQPTAWLVGTALQVLGLAVTIPEGTALTGRLNTFGYLTDLDGVPIAV